MTTPAFGCEHARSRIFPVNGLRLHGFEWGTPGRPGLLFLHGGAAHAHWFDRVAPSFADRFHVVSLDQRGHGESEWPLPPAYATEDFAADIAAVAGALGWERFVLAGHSMGGHNAIGFAAWYAERLAALVVIDSRPAIPPQRLAMIHRRGQRPPRRHPCVDSALASFRLLPPETTADPALLAHVGRAGLISREGHWCYRFDPGADAHRQPADGWQLLGKITAPTLVVRGEWSPIMPRELAEEVCAGIPRAGLVEIPGTYHHLVLDAPEAFAVALDDFLRAQALG